MKTPLTTTLAAAATLLAITFVGVAGMLLSAPTPAVARYSGIEQLSENDLILLDGMDAGSLAQNQKLAASLRGVDLEPLPDDEAAVAFEVRDDRVFLFSGSLDSDNGIVGLQQPGQRDKIGIFDKIVLQYPSTVPRLERLLEMRQDREDFLRDSNDLPDCRTATFVVQVMSAEQVSEDSLTLVVYAFSGCSNEGVLSRSGLIKEYWQLSSAEDELLLLSRDMIAGASAAR